MVPDAFTRCGSRDSYGIMIMIFSERNTVGKRIRRNIQGIMAVMINGPMRAGITAIGKTLAEKKPETALIDGDCRMDIHPFARHTGEEDAR